MVPALSCTSALFGRRSAARTYDRSALSLVSELLVRLAEGNLRFGELRVDLQGALEFDDGLRVLLVLGVGVAALQVFLLGDGRVLPAAGHQQGGRKQGASSPTARPSSTSAGLLPVREYEYTLDIGR